MRSGQGNAGAFRDLGKFQSLSEIPEHGVQLIYQLSPVGVEVARRFENPTIKSLMHQNHRLFSESQNFEKLRHSFCSLFSLLMCTGQDPPLAGLFSTENNSLVVVIFV